MQCDNPWGDVNRAGFFRSCWRAVKWVETVHVLWRNRWVEINSLEIEERYFEQKPDRHRPFVWKMREQLRLCEFMEFAWDSACVCVYFGVCMCKHACVQTLLCVNEGVCMHICACAWVQLYGYVSILVCALIRRGFFLRRRKQLTVLVLSWV